MLSVNFSYVSFIYAEIFVKMLSGGLEVSFSIFLLKFQTLWLFNLLPLQLFFQFEIENTFKIKFLSYVLRKLT